MKALVYEGTVVQVSAEEFLVAAGLAWVDAAAEVEPGYLYDGTNFTAPFAEPEPELPAVSESEMLEALWDKANGNNTKFDAAELKRNP